MDNKNSEYKLSDSFFSTSLYIYNWKGRKKGNWKRMTGRKVVSGDILRKC